MAVPMLRRRALSPPSPPPSRGRGHSRREELRTQLPLRWRNTSPARGAYYRELVHLRDEFPDVRVDVQLINQASDRRSLLHIRAQKPLLKRRRIIYQAAVVTIGHIEGVAGALADGGDAGAVYVPA